MSGKDHARVNLGIWGDDDWLDLPPEAQHLYFVLWTSPALSYCGSGDWHPGRIAALAQGWTADDVEVAGSILSARRFVIIDGLTDEFLLRSWIKWDGLWKVPNMSVSVANARSVLASRALRGVIVHEVRKIRTLNPDSSSWDRAAVASMLDQTPVDPASLPAYNPSVNPGDKAMDKGLPNPRSNLTVNPYSVVEVNPPANPAPTPAPSPTPVTPSPRGSETGGNLTNALPESEPLSSRCSKHEHDVTPLRCGACREARLRVEAAEAERVEQAHRERRAAIEANAERVQAEIDDCDMCDQRGYRNGRVCSHDPDEDARRRRGIEKTRRALAGEPIEDEETA